MTRRNSVLLQRHLLSNYAAILVDKPYNYSTWIGYGFKKGGYRNRVTTGRNRLHNVMSRRTLFLYLYLEAIARKNCTCLNIIRIGMQFFVEKNRSRFQNRCLTARLYLYTILQPSIHLFAAAVGQNLHLW